MGRRTNLQAAEFLSVRKLMLQTTKIPLQAKDLEIYVCPNRNSNVCGHICTICFGISHFKLDIFNSWIHHDNSTLWNISKNKKVSFWILSKKKKRKKDKFPDCMGLGRFSSMSWRMSYNSKILLYNKLGSEERAGLCTLSCWRIPESQIHGCVNGVLDNQEIELFSHTDFTADGVPFSATITPFKATFAHGRGNNCEMSYRNYRNKCLCQ